MFPRGPTKSRQEASAQIEETAAMNAVGRPAGWSMDTAAAARRSGGTLFSKSDAKPVSNATPIAPSEGHLPVQVSPLHSVVSALSEILHSFARWLSANVCPRA